MANVLGSAGTKPSVTLTVAGRKLLELVYKAVPSVLLVSLASLPLQQQAILKKLLETTVPEIEGLVVAAGRSDWNHHKSLPGGASLGGGGGGGGGEKGMKMNHRAPTSSSAAAAASSSSSHPYSDNLTNNNNDNDNNYPLQPPLPPATTTTSTANFLDSTSTSHNHPHLDGSGDYPLGVTLY